MNFNLQETIKVKFEVIKIRYRKDDGYSIIEAKFIDYPRFLLPTNDIIIIGMFPSIFVDDEFEGEGCWKENKTYGYNFVLNTNKRILPRSEKGIIEFLKKLVRGLGETKAKRIVKAFGYNTLSVIENNWELLSDIPSISEKLAIKIHEKYVYSKKIEEVAIFVLSNGGNHKTTIKIYEKFGDGSILKIRENPYCLCDVEKLDFTIADKFAKNLKCPTDSPDRIKSGLMYFLDLDSKRTGNLFLFKEDLISKYLDFLINHSAYKDIDQTNISSLLIQKNIDELIKYEKIILHIDKDGKECIYLKKYFFWEIKIVSFLKKLIEEKKEPICTKSQLEEVMDKYEETQKIKFANKQKKAISMALTEGFSILTGGPGTGKTQTINFIIRCLKKFKPDFLIELCAPTGKASKRMSEITGMEAKTIHRLIGLNGFDEENETHEIVADYLIIDEASMIDIYVFYKLLESIDDNTRVLFVGDYQQLPSVGPGLILRDLIESKKIPVTILDEIFRQSSNSQIVLNSHKIINCDNNSEILLSFDNNKEDFYFIEKSDKLATQKLIIQSVKNLITNKKYKLSDIQILSPVRKGDLGVNILNQLMQQEFNPPNETKNEVSISENMYLREGDKVIQTCNNYDLGVFNGEVGEVCKIYQDENENYFTEIDFGDKYITYKEIEIDEVMLAYAITIHKSQGSEFPIIIMPIHSSQERMLNKNIIYTAWTRAKEKVIIVGQKSVLDKSIKKEDNTKRNSKIKEKIINSISSNN